MPLPRIQQVRVSAVCPYLVSQRSVYQPCAPALSSAGPCTSLVSLPRFSLVRVPALHPWLVSHRSVYQPCSPVSSFAGPSAGYAIRIPAWSPTATCSTVPAVQCILLSRCRLVRGCIRRVSLSEQAGRAVWCAAQTKTEPLTVTDSQYTQVTRLGVTEAPTVFLCFDFWHSWLRWQRCSLDAVLLAECKL